MMHHALGGEEVAAVSVAQAAIAPSIARRAEIKRAPRVAGIYIATPEFQRWRGPWRQAAAQGREQEALTHAHSAVPRLGCGSRLTWPVQTFLLPTVSPA
jgi:hypothetical protein